MPHAPQVSVILPVRNGADCVARAIDSILGQTFRDLELIVIDDGSTDDTAAVLEGLATANGDERLRVVGLERNRGLAAALNHGLSLARGRYVARQDHDDISLPDRLAAQVRHLDAHPRCGLLGTRSEIWVGDAASARFHDHPTDNAALQFHLLTDNPFVHSSVMLRTSVFDAVGVYATETERQPPEDFELWSRIARRFEVANLPERLVIYRETPKSISRTGSRPFLHQLVLISSENLWHASGGATSMQLCRDAAALFHAACDRVSPQCDIEAVCRLVDVAANQIEARNPGADLGPARDRTLRHLREHHAACRGSGSSYASLRSIAGRMPVVGPLGRRVMTLLRIRRQSGRGR
jgi:hypothetical protein